MPYIKAEKRSFYDDKINILIAYLQNDNITQQQMKELSDSIISYLIIGPETDQDGELNYFITKTLKKLNWISDSTMYYSFHKYKNKLQEFLYNLLIQFYETPTPKYYRYNRMVGMLACCQLEFKRRYGMKAIIPITFLNMLLRQVYQQIGIYENEKIIQNGDV
jgi:hypothetical protein